MKFLYFLFVFFPSILCAQWVQVGNDIYGNPGDAFGPIITVMNADGSRIAVANAFSDSGSIPNVGVVRVYDLINEEWIQVGNDLHGNIYASEGFGYSVAINSSGEYIAVGISENGIGEGRAGVYELNGSNWVLKGSLISGEHTGDDLGTAIAISSDGQTIAISAPGNDDGGTSAGKIRSYKFESGNWIQVGQDIIGSSRDELGSAISLSANGDVLAVAASIAGTTNGNYTGKVLVYENQDGSWVQRGMDIIGSNTADGFGRSIDLNASGSRMIVGISGTDVVGNDNKGSVKVYQYDGSQWNPLGQELIGRIRSNGFGLSSAINDDGSKIIVGAPSSDPNNPYEGEVWFYKFENNSWRQYGSSLFGTELNDAFGVSVCISSNGQFVGVASGSSDLNPYDDAGKVSVYDTDALLGNDKMQAISIRLFPNPTQNSLFIQNDSEPILEVILYNQLGQIVQHYLFNNKDIALNIASFSEGYYFVKIITRSAAAIKQILKK